jgi:phospholipase C
MRKWTRRLTLVLVAAAAAGLAATTQAAVRGDGDGHNSDTRTPIRHLVVIFQENVSFDHYFGTYPTAANTGGQPFAAAPHTPKVAGLTPALLTSNPNSSQPARLDSSPTGLAGSAGGQLTCDQDHNYSDEQQAFDGGKMDQFVQSVGTAGGTSPFGTPCNPSIVMDYYDGNTVTAFWNYAQRYAMSDNSFSPTFGPSAPGAVTSSPATPGTST